MKITHDEAFSHLIEVVNERRMKVIEAENLEDAEDVMASSRTKIIAAVILLSSFYANERTDKP